MFEFIIYFIIFVVVINMYANRIERKRYNAMSTEEKTLYQLELNSDQNNSIIWILLAGPVGSLIGFLVVIAFIISLFN